MALQVASGATIMCTMGLAPGQLIVTSQIMVLMGGAPAATIQDVTPIVNVVPCGMCTSMANPTVASATAAALGVLTPMPCVPAPAGTWTPSNSVLVGGIPCLTQTASLVCSYGGSISIINPAQTTVVY